MLKKTLNIGCGDRTYSEYPNGYECTNFDNRADLEVIDVVGDAKLLNMFSDESFDYILASDIIEHFPISETHSILNEWLRVLRPGGTIEFRLPNLEEICTDYLKKKDDFRTDKQGDIPMAEFFSWVIFGGQNFPGNCHYVIFDRKWFNHICAEVNLKEISWEKQGYNMVTKYQKA